MSEAKPNFSQLTRDLISLIRGRRSQTTLNRKLKYRSNQIHRWESGQRKVPWSQFVQICRFCRIDISRILLNVLFYPMAPERWDLLASQLMVGKQLKDVSVELGVSHHTVRRWQKGQSEPSVDEIFSLMTLFPDRLESFVTRLASNGGFAVPLSLGRRMKDASGVMFQFQIAGALTAALELESYHKLTEHSSQWLADRLGVDLPEIDECLTALVEAGLVSIQSQHYRVEDKVLDTSGGDPRARILIRAFWYERFLGAILCGQLKLGGNSRLSYLLHALSEEAYKEIIERIRLLYLDVDRIVRDDRDRPKDRIYYLGIDFVDLAEVRKIES